MKRHMKVDSPRSLHFIANFFLVVVLVQDLILWWIPGLVPPHFIDQFKEPLGLWGSPLYILPFPIWLLWWSSR